MKFVSRCFIGLLVVVLVSTHVHLTEKNSAALKGQQQALVKRMVLPSGLVQGIPAEFLGVVSDYLFLEVLTYYGMTLERVSKPRVMEWEFDWMLAVLNQASLVDPYFYDLYYLANSLFSWEEDQLPYVNDLLIRGVDFRSWDYRLPYFVGFNYFYFEHDYERAGDFLAKAAMRPGATGIVSTLAVRMMNRANRTDAALDFIDSVVNVTNDGIIKEELVKRRSYLQTLHDVEVSVRSFINNEQRLPGDIDELVAKRYLASDPIDPFGGYFYINYDGTVKSSSDMYYKKLQPPPLLRKPD